MKIAVTNIGRTFGRQTRAYAEYRVFSSLARFSHVVLDATVYLRPPTVKGRSVVCRVSVTVEGGSCLQVTARGRHPYDAINRAADLIGDALRTHGDVAVPS
jgi:ribosome-associated translation inhibitor RaiA